MTLAEKIAYIQDHFNEWAVGWDDSGCFYHFHYGNRGAGRMMSGSGWREFCSEAAHFEAAVDEFIAHIKETCGE